MKKRLTKIYTRTGDDGTTGLADNSRHPKDGLRFEAMGDIDELNSIIGLLVSVLDSGTEKDLLQQLQNQLFDLGGELAIPETLIMQQSQVDALEQAIDQYNASLPSLKEFILPGGNPAAAHCHHARTVCRRAERSMVRLSRHEQVNPISLMYLNRLSDLLFVLARTFSCTNGGKEILWQRSEQHQSGHET